MKFLDGFKTIIGSVGLLVTVVAPKLDPAIVGAVGQNTVNIATNVFAIITAIGLVHKAVKAAK